VYFVVIIILAFVLGTGLYILRKYDRARELLPWFAWVVRLIQVSVDHWGFQQRYRDEADLAARFFVMAGSIVTHSDVDLRDTRKSVAAMIDKAYATFYPGKRLTAPEKSIMLAAFVTAISHDEIMETLSSVFTTHEDLDVRKATLLVVDILGEMIYLKDKLGQQYFQHVVYGLNKCLKLLRDKGTDKRNLKEITSTLFRIYKLTKAYRHRRKLSGMPAGDFYDKIISIVEHMAYVVTVK
jgi:hypothetical protein